MKKVIGIVLAVTLLLTVMAVPVLAKGPSGPAGKSNVGHIYLVEKDPDTWEIVEGGAWGKLKYSLDGSTLDVVLNAHGLVPGDWHLVELVDKDVDDTGWTVLSPDNYSSFYGQADSDGNVNIAFSLDIGTAADIEVNLKNADNVALLEPSTGGVPEEWILGTGQGWGFVLYAEAQINDTPTP